jgi:hypothetical protein
MGAYLFILMSAILAILGLGCTLMKAEFDSISEPLPENIRSHRYTPNHIHRRYR